MEQIKFSTNWNNKLDCLYYTTIRLGNFKYQLGRDYDIVLKEKHLHIAQIKQIRIRSLWEIDEHEFMLDTGYEKIESLNIIMGMYKNIDWNKQRVFYMTLKRIDIYNKSTQAIE